MSWARRFDEPIPLCDGRDLVTLKDAGNYITKLPKAEHETAELAVAVAALRAETVARLQQALAARDCPNDRYVMDEQICTAIVSMLARIGMMLALNRRIVRPFSDTPKRHHWGRRKLARDL